MDKTSVSPYKIFISSPYSGGDVEANVMAQQVAFDQLANAGLRPFAPLLWHFQQKVFPRSYDDWTNMGLEWLVVCDMLVRLPGESTGADAETAVANRLGIEVFYSVEDVITRAREYAKLEDSDNDKMTEFFLGDIRGSSGSR